MFFELYLFFSHARRPIRGIKAQNSGASAISMRSVNLSSEEGEASEYPSSQRSTLESNPDTEVVGATGATMRGAHALRAMHSYGRSDESVTTPTRSRLTVPESLKRMKAVGSRDEPLQRIPTLHVTSAHHESPLKRMAAVRSQDISAATAEPLRRAPAVSQQDSLKRMAAVSTDDLSAAEDNENMVITIQCLDDAETAAGGGEGNLTIAPETSHGPKTITLEM